MSGKRSGIYPFLYEGYEFTFPEITCDNCELVGPMQPCTLHRTIVFSLVSRTEGINSDLQCRISSVPVAAMKITTTAWGVVDDSAKSAITNYYTVY